MGRTFHTPAVEASSLALVMYLCKLEKTSEINKLKWPSPLAGVRSCPRPNAAGALEAKKTASYFSPRFLRESSEVASSAFPQGVGALGEGREQCPPARRKQTQPWSAPVVPHLTIRWKARANINPECLTQSFGDGPKGLNF